MNKIYYNNKYVESIIYDVELQNKLSNKMQIDPSFLFYLNSYINLNDSQHFIDDSLKEKLFMLVEYMRFDLEYHDDFRYNEVLNEIVIKLNKIKVQNTVSFYYNQANIRAHDSEKTSISEKVERLFELHDMICKSISYDFQVLEALYLDEADFKRLLPNFAGNGWFLCSIKGMYAENSKMFDDNQVKSNLDEVINENDRILKKTLLIQSSHEIKRQILKR